MEPFGFLIANNGLFVLIDLSFALAAIKSNEDVLYESCSSQE